ncbi:MAG: ion transporter [Flavobacteriales bacterium]|nr:ion transporter [Flavobacteriales bacterium]
MKGSRERLHEIIFEADTPAGKRFDVLLLWLIVASVITVMAETVPDWHNRYIGTFVALEWLFTALFTIEYLVRLLVVKQPLRYATSFFGVVDLLAILPTFVGLLVPGSGSLRIIRILRLLRAFRVLKLVGFIEEARGLQTALRASRRRIIVFLSVVLALVTILGTLMYLVEDGQSGFSSIPKSIYWAIVTVTTVGYGDIAPQTIVGQLIASCMMIIGYAIIAVPTGMIGVEMIRKGAVSANVSTQACPACGRDGHDPDADHCKYCGNAL